MKHIKQLNIKITVLKMSLEMTLENDDVCDVVHVCWKTVPN